MNDDAPSTSVERLFPFVLKSRALLVGRDTLKRSKGRLHFVLITRDLSDGSRAQLLKDFAHYPIVQHFTEAELVEIGFFIALTMGQQRWLRTLNIEHHQVLAGTDASMAPGFESEQALQRSKSDPAYWAAKPARSAAE